MTDLLSTPSLRDAPVRTGERWQHLTADLDLSSCDLVLEPGSGGIRSINSSHGHYLALAADRRSRANRGMRRDTIRPART